MGIIKGYVRDQLHGISGAGVTFSIPQQEDFTITGTSQSWTSTDVADREIVIQYTDQYAAFRAGGQINVLLSSNMVGAGLTYSGGSFSVIGGTTSDIWVYSTASNTISVANSFTNSTVVINSGTFAYPTAGAGPGKQLICLDAQGNAYWGTASSTDSDIWVLNGGNIQIGSTWSGDAVVPYSAGNSSLGTYIIPWGDIIIGNANFLTDKDNKNSITMAQGADNLVIMKNNNSGNYIRLGDTGGIVFREASGSTTFNSSTWFAVASTEMVVSTPALLYDGINPSVAHMSNSYKITKQAAATYSVGTSSNTIASINCGSNSITWVKAYVSGYKSDFTLAYTSEYYAAFNTVSSVTTLIGVADSITNHNFPSIVPTFTINTSSPSITLDVTGDNVNILTWVVTYDYQISTTLF